ncbi:hypothetical protein F8M41_018576 [Gigaspora margarita]|uniref:Uncharacterized protein n=1 Tax=Gigaspora margarita TaxID=4874 RepID=A0A8H3WRK6_GIGMA|nr:hypothetical protein F8M41_018576 [Gigaspora margarita]
MIFISYTFIVLTLISHAIAGDPYSLPNMTYKTDIGYYYNMPVRIYGLYAYNTNSAPAISPFNPIYVFLRGAGDDTTNVLQPSVVDFIPGDDGYSDLKRVTIVTGVTDSSGTIKSYDDLKKLGNKVRTIESDIYVNLPVVGFSAKLEFPSDGPEMFGYYKGVQFRYFNFGINPAGNATAPIYHVYAKNGTQIAAIPGTIPGLSNYSGIWNIYNLTVTDVTVPITSYNQIANLEKVFSGIVSNCPVSTTTLTGFSGPNSKKRSRK